MTAMSRTNLSTGSLRALGWAGRALFVLFGLLVALAVRSAPATAQLPGQPVLAFEQEIRGTEEQDVRWPVAVASGHENEVAVADARGSRLLVFRQTETGRGGSWSLVAAAGLPATPAGLAWDGARYVVSLRGQNHLLAAEGDRLALRNVPLPDGVLAGVLAGRPGGGLLVYDLAGHRVLRLDAAGRPASGEVAEARVDGRVTALAAAAGGGFYSAVAESATVRRHKADGTVEASWTVPSETPTPAWPSGLAVGPDGDVFVVDRHNGRVLVFQVGGSLVGFGSRPGWEPGLIRFPSGLALLPDGRVAVADQGNGRVQIFRRVREGGGR